MIHIVLSEKFEVKPSYRTLCGWTSLLSILDSEFSSFMGVLYSTRVLESVIRTQPARYANPLLPYLNQPLL
jgi:hypothetical protein